MDDEASTNDRFTRRAARDAEAAAAEALADRVLKAREDHYRVLPLDDDVRAEFDTGRGLKRGSAQRRQARYCARMLIGVERAPIAAALDRAEAGQALEVEVLHAAERWRCRLLDDDGALTRFVDAHPQVDRQRLAQLVRAARRERDQGKAPAASRALFKLLRPLLETADE